MIHEGLGMKEQCFVRLWDAFLQFLASGFFTHRCSGGFGYVGTAVLILAPQQCRDTVASAAAVASEPWDFSSGRNFAFS